MINVLILCTGNICRSPAAEAMLRDRLHRLGVAARVRSAGVLHDGQPAHSNSVSLLADRGLDISGHRSQRVSPDILRTADLVLGMAREHVREAVVMYSAAFPRAFTLKELVRRGKVVGPRAPVEAVPAWLDRVNEGRTTADLLGLSDADDVADPIGQPRTAYERMLDDLDEQLGQLVDLLWVPDHERSST